MDLSQLEQALRAAKEITGEKDFVVIGSASVLGQYPKEGEELTRLTKDVDIFPLQKRTNSLPTGLERLGEMSPFQEKNGFYINEAHDRTAFVPEGWEKRLVKVGGKNPEQAVGWCLDVNDLAVAKIWANREKDFIFVQTLFEKNLADPKIVRQGLTSMNCFHEEQKKIALSRLDQCIKNAQEALKKNCPPSKGQQRLMRKGISGPQDYPRGREQDHGPELER